MSHIMFFCVFLVKFLTYISSINTWASGDSSLAQLVKELEKREAVYFCVYFFKAKHIFFIKLTKVLEVVNFRFLENFRLLTLYCLNSIYCFSLIIIEYIYFSFFTFHTMKWKVFVDLMQRVLNEAISTN